MRDNLPKDNTAKLRRGVIIGGISAVLLYAGWTIGAVIYWHDALGVFGDSFGVVNALFSGLALIVVALSILQAQQQLKVQQDELQLNTEELKGQREQMVQQNDHLRREAARNQFFQMLDSWQRIVHETRVVCERPSTSDHLHGRDAFAFMAARLDELDPAILVTESDDDRAPLRLLEGARNLYASLYNEHGDKLGHYFRLMYHTIRLIHMQRCFSEEEKYDFIRSLRAHLSQSELLLLFYNGISPHGERLYPLIEKYDLLQNFDIALLKNRHHLLMYPKRFLAERDRLIHSAIDAGDSNLMEAQPFYVHAIPEDCHDNTVVACLKTMCQPQ